MEDIHKVEDDEVIETVDTTPETDTATDDESDEPKDIDYEAELKTLQEKEIKKEKPTELEKAKKALYFNAERLKELGGDPEEILGKPKKKEPEETGDIDAKLERKFVERDVRSVVSSEAEYNLVMHYVDKGLTIEDAHLLANKGKIKRAVDEAKRGNVSFGKVDNGTRIVTEVVPQRSAVEQQLLQRRGLAYNPKTKTWQGKFTEEYYDRDSKTWKSRKLTR